MGVYPFMFGAAKDFEPIFQDMTKVSTLMIKPVEEQSCSLKMQRGLKEPYDWDEYAESFRPKAEELVSRATKAEKAGEEEKATELFLFVHWYSDNCASIDNQTDEPLPFIESPGFLAQGQKSRSRLGQRARRHSIKDNREHRRQRLQ